MYLFCSFSQQYGRLIVAVPPYLRSKVSCRCLRRFDFSFFFITFAILTSEYNSQELKKSNFRETMTRPPYHKGKSKLAIYLRQ